MCIYMLWDWEPTCIIMINVETNFKSEQFRTYIFIRLITDIIAHAYGSSELTVVVYVCPLILAQGI